MSSYAASSPSSQPTSLNNAFNGTAGAAQKNAGLSIGSFVASLGSGLAVFGVELALFLLLNARFPRI